MIKAIINGIMKLIISLVSLLLAPLDALIESLLPDVSAGFSMIASFFQLAGNYFGYVADMMYLNNDVKALLIAYFGVKLTLPLLTSAIKQALKWYNTVKI